MVVSIGIGIGIGMIFFAHLKYVSFINFNGRQNDISVLRRILPKNHGNEHPPCTVLVLGVCSVDSL
jgi:hypothetical protein